MPRRITEGILNLIAVFHDEAVFEPRLDFAVRGWAHQSDAVTARVNAADERRLAAIREMFERFGYASDDADVRARTVYLVQIGYISMQVQESAADADVAGPALRRDLLGPVADRERNGPLPRAPQVHAAWILRPIARLRVAARLMPRGWPRRWG